MRPHSTEEVSTIVKIANKYKIPVTPYGGGTSLEGHFSGVRHISFYSNNHAISPNNYFTMSSRVHLDLYV